MGMMATYKERTQLTRQLSETFAFLAAMDILINNLYKSENMDRLYLANVAFIF